MKKLCLVVGVLSQIILVNASDNSKEVVLDQLRQGLNPVDSGEFAKQIPPVPQEVEKEVNKFLSTNGKNLKELLKVDPQVFYNQPSLRDFLIKKARFIKQNFGNLFIGQFSKFTNNQEELAPFEYELKISEKLIGKASGPFHAKESLNFKYGNQWGTYLAPEQPIEKTYQTISSMLGYLALKSDLENYQNSAGASPFNLFDTHAIRIGLANKNWFTRFWANLFSNNRSWHDGNVLIVQQDYDREKIKPVNKNLEVLKNVSFDQIESMYNFIKQQPAGRYLWDIKDKLLVDATQVPPVFYYANTQHPNNTSSDTFVGYVPKTVKDEARVLRHWEFHQFSALHDFFKLLLDGYNAKHVEKNVVVRLINMIQKDFVDQGIWINNDNDPNNLSSNIKGILVQDFNQDLGETDITERLELKKVNQ